MRAVRPIFSGAGTKVRKMEVVSVGGGPPYRLIAVANSSFLKFPSPLAGEGQGEG
jgi:hypothetical protein